jgi:transposase
VRSDDHGKVHRDGRIPDELWAPLAPLFSPRTRHPRGCHRARVPDRHAMEAICGVLRPGCHGNALNATGICASRSAQRRVHEGTAAGVVLA